jgi:hypothetical protein
VTVTLRVLLTVVADRMNKRPAEPLFTRDSSSKRQRTPGNIDSLFDHDDLNGELAVTTSADETLFSIVKQVQLANYTLIVKTLKDLEDLKDLKDTVQMINDKRLTGDIRDTIMKMVADGNLTAARNAGGPKSPPPSDLLDSSLLSAK